MIEVLLFGGLLLFVAVRALAVVARLSSSRRLKLTKGAESALTEIGSLSAENGLVRLDAQSASINVTRSSKVSAVTVRVNKPEHWAVGETQITQVAVERSILTVFGIAGDIAQIIAWLQGRHEDVVALGSDQIEIVFPEHFSGDFEASYGGVSDFSICAWSQGNLKIEQSGSADGKFADLCGLGAFHFVQDSIGETQFGSIAAKHVSLQANGSGDISVDGAVEAGVFDIRSYSLCEWIFGSTIIADSIHIDLNGSGDLTIDGKVVASDSFLLESSSLSEIALEAIEGGDVSLLVSGSGDLTVNNCVRCDNFSSRQTSLGEVTIDELWAQRADIHCSGSADFTADGGAAHSGSAITTSLADIHLNGDFDLRVRSTRHSGAVYINE
jgi:hypothetical protein